MILVRLCLLIFDPHLCVARLFPVAIELLAAVRLKFGDGAIPFVERDFVPGAVQLEPGLQVRRLAHAGRFLQVCRCKKPLARAGPGPKTCRDLSGRRRDFPRLTVSEKCRGGIFRDFLTVGGKVAASRGTLKRREFRDFPRV
jgi:hypothetical protein